MLKKYRIFVDCLNGVKEVRFVFTSAITQDEWLKFIEDYERQHGCRIVLVEMVKLIP